MVIALLNIVWWQDLVLFQILRLVTTLVQWTFHFQACLTQTPKLSRPLTSWRKVDCVLSYRSSSQKSSHAQIFQKPFLNCYIILCVSCVRKGIGRLQFIVDRVVSLKCQKIIGFTMSVISILLFNSFNFISFAYVSQFMLMLELISLNQ